MTDKEERTKRVLSWEIRAAALVERQVAAHPAAREATVDGQTYAIGSDSGELPKEPVKTTLRKPSRAERERTYQEAEARFQTERTDASRQKLQAAFDALRPASPKHPAKKRPRRIVLRDHYPTDRSRFSQWLWRQHDQIEDPEEQLKFIEELSERAVVPVERLAYWINCTRAEKADKDEPDRYLKRVSSGKGKSRLAPLYPTDSEIDACIEVCANRGEYFEVGLSGANQLVTFMFLLLEQQKMSANALSRATNIPLKTIESWGSGSLKSRKEPTLNDLVACFEELGRPLVPARERNASALFLHEFAALQLAQSKSADSAPDARRMKIPTRRG